MRPLTLIAVLVFAGPAVSVAQEPATASAESEIISEARAMMEGYAAVLRAGDRAAIADLYDRRGAWIFWEGQGAFRAHDAIVGRYAEQWAPPAAFEWRDLAFVPTGPDSITVAGRFEWTAPGETMRPAFYHGQFVRQNGRLRIQVEHEGRIAPSPDQP